MNEKIAWKTTSLSFSVLVYWLSDSANQVLRTAIAKSMNWKSGKEVKYVKNTRVQRRAWAIGQGAIFQVNISTIGLNDKGTTLPVSHVKNEK